jgi:hypothetical protein
MASPTGLSFRIAGFLVREAAQVASIFIVFMYATISYEP